MLLNLDYTSPSTVQAGSEDHQVNFTTNYSRQPVYFCSTIKTPMLLRYGLQALKSVIYSDDTWITSDEFVGFTLDPVVTVHPDEVFFEAFSQDESSYGRLSIPRICFDEAGETQLGTTNIDFTWAFSKAIENLRSSRTTHFNVGQKAVEVETTGIKKHIEKKVDLPDSWLKGFLQIQAGLTLPTVSFDISPPELLNVIWYLRENKAKVSPRALRFELKHNEPVNLILEPWEESFVFKKSIYTGRDRTIRVWGRRRLRILESILPYCDKVTVYLCGRSMPSFYVCHMEQGGIFLLALSGWTANDWSKGSNFTTLMPHGFTNETEIKTILDLLMEHKALSIDRLIEMTSLDKKNLVEALFKLCKSGNCIYDLTNQQYRHRQLFDEPIEIKKLFDEDESLDEAEDLIKENKVHIDNIELSELPIKRKYYNPMTGEKLEKVVGVNKETKITANVTDDAEGVMPVKLSLNDEGRIVFGSCKCKFFDYNILSRGPCKHLQAVNLLYTSQVQQLEKLNQ